MEVSILGAAADALHTLADPFRLLMLGLGVLMGLVLGIIPGIGGLVGMALLLPYTFTMDPYAAFAVLLGMSAVVGTSDTIPAVLFGVPGTAGAQATVMDGNPMAKKGEAGRALSAAFTASLIGGLVGAAILALTIPILRPVMRFIASPELFGFAVFGLAMVAVLSGTSPMRGLVAAGIGVMLSMIGSDPQTGTLRYTFDTLYLWDGLPIVPIVLGLFAIPELADLAVRRASIASSGYDTKKGTMQGIRDACTHWWLAVRGGGIGAAVGAIPGLGSAVVDWIAYGWALQTIKGAEKTFGKGDVRGVIAPESANNALTAGALVPTIAFGVPGSASMAVLLSVFLIHGLVPGPDMLSKNLDVTYVMIWSVALANILGAGICILFSGQLAKIAQLRYTLVIPAVLVFVFIGAYQSRQSWGDLYALLFFVVLGCIMKFLRWPRPPLILGFVLGGLMERYLFISNSRYGAEWLERPLVVVLLLTSVLLFIVPLVRRIRQSRGLKGAIGSIGAPRFASSDLFYLLVFATVGAMVLVASTWDWSAKIGPLLAGSVTLTCCAISFFALILTRQHTADAQHQGAGADEVHMDSTSDFSDLEPRLVAWRLLTFFGYIVFFIAAIAVVGIYVTIPIFVCAYMRLERRESWGLTLALAASLTLLVFLIFDRSLHINWPDSLLETWWTTQQVDGAVDVGTRLS
ncbi:tripartite tricarboxylate transporter permease [Mesorhizobium sp. CAU 1741]|uniref:tripartite tricarboxylate transporter permease n=1 Tax=Mesorhizobium sp. CAU 1741 TaxID=3140366 RepID=UPI00325B2E1D